MSQHRRTVRLDDYLHELVEGARGEVPFEPFARRALQNECLRIRRAHEKAKRKPLEGIIGDHADSIINPQPYEATADER